MKDCSQVRPNFVVILNFVTVHDKEASSVSNIVLAASFREKRSDVIDNDVISLIMQMEILSFTEKREKKVGKKVLHTIHNSVIF